jgi:molybdopterin-containing oxidoreductase family iron-sulfur binding subunit
MSGVNPLYSLPNASDFAEGLQKTELSIAFSMKADETASQTQFIAGTPHY